MSNTERQHDRLLKEHGFELVRTTKHRVYRNPEGRVYVMSSTPSDWRVANNRLTALKRCLSSPIKPMSLAISDFERQEAAARIEGRKKVVTGIVGGVRSRGTGFVYHERRTLTLGQIQQTEAVRQQALANRLRRQEAQNTKLAERRTRKLIRLQAEAQAEEEFRSDYQVWLDAIENTLDMLDRNYEHMTRVFQDSPAWKEQFYYEFPIHDPEDTGVTEEEVLVMWAHQFFRDQVRSMSYHFERGDFDGCGCDECLKQTELSALFFGDHLIPQADFTRDQDRHEPDGMIRQVLHAAERQIKRDKSWIELENAILAVPRKRRQTGLRFYADVLMLVDMMDRWDYDRSLFDP